MSHDGHNGQEGIFTQPGPDGIFGRSGPPQDASAPPIDGDDTPLRETLVVVYPSPGHMRVARAVRHPKTGAVEFQEEYRVPTPEEVDYLKRVHGIEVGPGSMVVSQTGVSAAGAPAMPSLGDVAPPPPPTEMSTGKKVAITVGALTALALAGFAAWKWGIPLLNGEGKSKENPEDESDVHDADEPEESDVLDGA